MPSWAAFHARFQASFGRSERRAWRQTSVIGLRLPMARMHVANMAEQVNTPALADIMPVSGSLLQQCGGHAARLLVGRKETAKGLSENVFGFVALDVLGALIPRGNAPRGVEQVNGIILDPLHEHPKAFFARVERPSTALARYPVSRSRAALQNWMRPSGIHHVHGLMEGLQDSLVVVSDGVSGLHPSFPWLPASLRGACERSHRHPFRRVHSHLTPGAVERVVVRDEA